LEIEPGMQTTFIRGNARHSFSKRNGE
jgi:hypothetical protein